MFSVVIVIVETLHCIERQNKSNPAKESSPRADRCETFPPTEWAAFPFSRKADSLLLSCCCCAQQTFHLNLCLCREMEDAMMPPDERKRCWGCTSLRSATIIVGAFDILVSSIAIIVSVAAIVHTQVFSNLCFLIMRKTYRRRKLGLTLKEGRPGAPLPNVRG